MKLKGKLVVLIRPRKIKFENIEIDTDKIGTREIIGRTIFSAISPGTEAAAYSGKPALRPGKIYPRLLGYCNVARVVSAGNGVKSVRPGDMILTGESHRSIFKIPETDVWAKLPKKISPEDASLAYLYNLGLNSLKAVKMEPGMNVAVIGLGILGLGIIEQAKNLGLNPIAFSDSRYKLKLAKKLGAEKVFLRNKSGNAEKLADLIITTSNSWTDWKLALRLAKPDGSISVLGFPGRGEGAPKFNPLEPKYFYDKKIAIIPSGRTDGSGNAENASGMIKNNCAEILKLIAGKKLHPKNLISEIYYYTEIEKAYKKLLARDKKSVTFILKWPQEKF